VQLESTCWRMHAGVDAALPLKNRAACSDVV
jgi:hypothetical protein